MLCYAYVMFMLCLRNVMIITICLSQFMLCLCYAWEMLCLSQFAVNSYGVQEICNVKPIEFEHS